MKSRQISLLDKYVSEHQEPEDFANWQELKEDMLEYFPVRDENAQPYTIKWVRWKLIEILEDINKEPKDLYPIIEKIFLILVWIDDVLDLFSLASRNGDPGDPDDFELCALEMLAYDHSSKGNQHRRYFYPSFIKPKIPERPKMAATTATSATRKAT